MNEAEKLALLKKMEIMERLLDIPNNLTIIICFLIVGYTIRKCYKYYVKHTFYEEGDEESEGDLNDMKHN